MPSKSAAYWQQGVFAVLLALAVVAANVWTVLSVTPAGVPLFGGEQGDYSNLVMHGILKGHTYVDVAPSAALVQARNPYDPATRPAGPVLADASLYKGHYYMYFGVAPVVTLFLPWRVLTGHDLPAPYAALILVNGAFLASVILWWMLRRRYFPDSGAVALATGILVIGLASMTHSVLRRTSIWEPPVAAGYLFAMLALVCLYLGIHGRRRVPWFASASLLLGLAVGSRPTYLVGVAALCVPLAAEGLRARKAGGGRALPGRDWWAEAAALGLPFGLIFAALLGYNYARFDNPFEFGMHYQLTGTYEAAVRHFSAAYVRFNAYVYYWAPAQWSRYFPFVEPIRQPAAPPGYQTCEYVYGILANIPFAWAALLAPLALVRRRPDESGPLGEFLGSLAALYISLGIFLLFFVTSAARYMLDFVPALMLLACIGLLSAERLARGRRMRALVLSVAAAAGLFSVFVCSMLNFQLQDLLRQLNPPLFRSLAHALDQPAWAMERRSGTRFGPAEMTLRFPQGRSGRTEPLVSTGWDFFSDYLFVNYIDARSLRIGFTHAGHPTLWSQPLALDFGADHRLRVQMGSLFPPRGHPFFDGWDDLQYGSVCRWLSVSLDGRVVLDAPQDFYDSSPGSVRFGSEPSYTYGGRFTGVIEAVSRGAYQVSASPGYPSGPLGMTVEIPPGAVGRQVPLVTTGKPGRGDALLMRATRPGFVCFYYDHWGDDLLSSGEVPVSGGGAHDLVVSLPSLWPGNADPASPFAHLLYVALDGRPLAMQDVAGYPLGRSGVSIARNAIGSSLCEAEYPWAVRDVRAGIPVALPAQGAAVRAWEPPGEAAAVQREAPAGSDSTPAGPGRTVWARSSLPPFGPVRLRLAFPIGYWTRQQPILCTGKTGAGTLVFVTYSDQGHIRIGADIWGSLYQSEPIPVRYSEPHEIVVNSSGLYPLDLPAVRALEPGTLQRLRNDFFVAVDGRTVLAESRPAFDSPASEVTVGENRILSSFSQPDFAGRILSMERLPFARTLRVLAGQAIRMRFRLDPDAGLADQPLLSLGADGGLGQYSARPMPGPFLRLCYRSPDGTTTESAPLADPPGLVHELEVVPGYADTARPQACVRATLDGLSVSSPDNFAAYSSCPATLGIDPAAAPGTGQFFAGPELGAEVLPPGEQPQAPSPTGRQLLIVRFPQDPAGSEPLVVSGVTGAGDFVYVKYVGAGRLRFGFDHWGVGGSVGEPVAFDPTQLHRLEIETGALIPSPAGQAASRVRVRLDGATVLDGMSAIHPHTRGQIYIGANPIGGSTAQLLFRGEVLVSVPAD